MRLSLLAAGTVVLALSACHAAPNIKSASDYDPPAAPPVKHPLYDPNAAYGEANATWLPPVFNRNGTIVAPSDPSVALGRPDYEHAPWATGAAGGNPDAPPGTF